MGPSGEAGPNVRDSVVSGDLHTGDVIHNHYHLPQQPPPVPQRPPVPPRTQHQQPQYQQPPAAYANYYQQHGARNLQTPQSKDVVLTYILWFLLGPLGAHRFYLNQVGMGIFYFLTFGGCGLLWLIDIALIPDLVNRANRTYVRN
ncbi:MAG: TM2 domain-containing protein [Candidatus Poseidoniales archaeon]|nr:hypothetical protein [Euryarchaeota archaeon]RJU91181.1 MAG: TM2 domain-containing protein [Candidatus Poseidoniales archaeon]